MPPTKIVDEQEVMRWFAEGKTYQEMSDIYRSKYAVTMTPSAWGNFRRRRGLEHRIARNTDLIPWATRAEHRVAYPVTMLRLEARRLEGMSITVRNDRKLAAWKAMLHQRGLVVAYDPTSTEGFSYVPREDGDHSLIRPPTSGLSSRPRAF